MSMDAAAPMDPIRVIAVYAARWRHTGGEAVAPEPSGFDLGHLRGHFALFAHQFPRLLAHRGIDLRFTGIGPDALARAETWLWALPSDEVVAAIDIDLPGGDLIGDP